MQFRKKKKQKKKKNIASMIKIALFPLLRRHGFQFSVGQACYRNYGNCVLSGQRRSNVKTKYNNAMLLAISIGNSLAVVESLSPTNTRVVKARIKKES